MDRFDRPTRRVGRPGGYYRVCLGLPPCMSAERLDLAAEPKQVVVGIAADSALLYQAPLLSIFSATASTSARVDDQAGEPV
jgi:hypothetical protein